MARRKNRSYQQGSVVKRQRRRGTVFIGRYRERNAHGSWKERSVTLDGCRTMKAARGKLDEILASLNGANGYSEERRDVAFTELIDTHFARYLANKEVKPSTRSVYRSLVKKWIRPFFGAMSLEAIGPETVGAFMAHLGEKGLSRKYRQNIYGVLKLLFEIAVDHDFVDGSPVRPKVHRPKTERVEKPVLEVESVGAIIRNADATFRAPIATLALTGLRVGELLGLQWRDVDYEKCTITIRRSVWNGEVQTPKTRTSLRTLGMSSVLRGILADHRETVRFSGSDDFVFSQLDGRPLCPDALRRQGIYPAMERAGIPIQNRASGTHAFRHLAGTLVHRQTGSLKLAQMQLGHSDVQTTGNIYTHVNAREIQEVAEVLGAALGTVCGPVVVQAPLGSERIQ